MRWTTLVLAALVLTACSASSSHHPASPPGSSSPLSASPGVEAVQRYVDQVNALCDALLPKVLAATHGGHDGSYPVRVYFAEEPAHAKARHQFDVGLAKVVVPPGAETQRAALEAYIAFANRIDAARAAAARKGQRAFDKQTVHERTVDLNSPVIASLEAAGFNESCTAR